MVRLQTILTLLALAAGTAGAQRQLTDEAFAAWVANDTPFVAIDVRGDASPDSIVYPCFYAPQALPVTQSFACTPRLLIYCHAGVYAAAQAAQVVAAGYPADSVYHSGFDTLVSSRFPASDTLPAEMLAPDADLPQDISALQLMASLPGTRPFRLIDVRTDYEVASGMIPGACHYTWTDPFQTEVAQFDKTGDIILYCASGTRAGNARTWLIGQGFDADKVINFGGFSKWTSAGGLSAYSSTSSCRTVCSGIGIRKRPGLPETAGFSAAPNPFSRYITINGRDAYAVYAVYTAEGVLIRRLPGNVWDGSDRTGRKVEPGIYLIRQDTQGRSSTLRIIKTR